jgi:hypothetical protein
MASARYPGKFPAGRVFEVSPSGSEKIQFKVPGSWFKMSGATLKVQASKLPECPKH